MFVGAERAVAVESVASMNKVKVESWHELFLDLYICDRTLRTVVVEDSTLLGKEYDLGRSCCRSSCGSPWREIQDVSFKKRGA